MIQIKEQAEQLYVELFGVIPMQRKDYNNQILQLMAIIQAQEQPEVKRGRKASNKTGE